MKYGGTWFLSIKKDECKKKSWTSTAREYKYIVFSFISQFWWRNSTLYIYEVFMLKNYLLYELSNAAGQKSYVISKRDCQTRAKTRTIRLTDLKTYAQLCFVARRFEEQFWGDFIRNLLSFHPPTTKVMFDVRKTSTLAFSDWFLVTNSHLICKDHSKRLCAVTPHKS